MNIIGIRYHEITKINKKIILNKVLQNKVCYSGAWNSLHQLLLFVITFELVLVDVQ